MFNENIGIMTMAIKYLEEFDNAHKNLEEKRIELEINRCSQKPL
jgi:hypothetical protein